MNKARRRTFWELKTHSQSNRVCRNNNISYSCSANPGVFLPLDFFFKMKQCANIESVNKNFFKQLRAEVDKEHPKIFKNAANITITLPLTNVLMYLFNTYLYISPSRAEVEEQRLKKTLYRNTTIQCYQQTSQDYWPSSSTMVYPTSKRQEIMSQH